jgi:two-component system, oxyanion-binding sensor
MMAENLTIGFLPLVDACLPILAREHGFAEEEGLSLRLVKDVSWATVLDRLLYGHSDAAHMVAPLAIATTLGHGRPAQPLSVPFVLGLNGNAITLRSDISQRVGAGAELGGGRRGAGANRPRAEGGGAAAALRRRPPLFEP